MKSAPGSLTVGGQRWRLSWIDALSALSWRRAGIKRVIGGAGGEAKAEAIPGALRGGHVNVLIADDSAALEVTRLDEQ